MNTRKCPSHDDLVAFAKCGLDDDTADRINEHLTACASCDETVVNLESQPHPVWSKLRGADAAADDDSGLPRFMAEIESFVRGGERTVVVSSGKHPMQIRDYRIIEPLGRGGMGTVYRAQHVRLDKTVALKLVSPEHLHSTGIVERFEREMKAIGQLDHPNIVRATDASEEDGHHFLVMDYVDGETLADIVRRHGLLPIREACELIRQAACGLQYAHENGLVHRDIKPSNLMLSTDGTVKILDLGLALLRDSSTPSSDELTTTGQMMGTVDYMAPEQGHDTHGVDIRADIYSLGATFYKLLTGRVVFDHTDYDTPLKRLAALASEEPHSIADLRADVPPELAALIHRMLAKDPADRFITPAEVAAALEPFVTKAELTSLLSEKPSVPVAEAGVTRHTSGPTGHAAPGTLPRPPRRVNRRVVLAAVALLLPLVFFSPLIVRIVTNKGVVAIETDSADFEVVIKDELGRIIDRKSEREFWLTAGEYGLDVTVRDSTGKMRFVTRELTLSRGGNETVRAYIEDAQSKTTGPVPIVQQPESGNSARDLPSPLSIAGARKRLNDFAWKPGPSATRLPGLAANPADIGADVTWNVRVRATVSPLSTWLSPHATYVIYRDHANDPLLFVLELGTARIRAAVEVEDRRGCFVAWSADESEFVVHDAAGRVTRYGIDGIPIARWHSKAPRRDPAWSDNGKRICLIGDGVIEIRDRNGMLVRTFECPPNPARLAWNPDHRRIAVQFGASTLRIFDVERDETIDIEESEQVDDLLWNPVGDVLHVRTGYQERRWLTDSPPKRLESQSPDGGAVVDFSPDGQFEIRANGDVANNDGDPLARLPVNAIDRATGGKLRSGHWIAGDRIRIVQRAWPGAFADFSPTGRLLQESHSAFALVCGTLHWNGDGTFHTVAAVPSAFQTLGRQHRFQWSLSGDQDSTASVEGDNVDPVGRFASYAPAAGKYAIPEIHSRAGHHVAVFDADGRRLYNLPVSYAEILAWNPEGRLLATASPVPSDVKSEIRIWSGADMIAQPAGLTTPVAGLLWSPDNAFLAAWDRAGTILVWNVGDFEQPVARAMTFPLSTGIFSSDLTTPRWSPDGGKLAFYTEDALHILTVAENATNTIQWDAERRGQVWWRPDGRSFLVKNTVYDDKGNELHTLTDMPRFGLEELKWTDAGKSLTGWRHPVVQIWPSLAAAPDTIQLPGFLPNHVDRRTGMAARGIGHHPISVNGRHMAAIIPRHENGVWGTTLGDVAAVDLQEKRLLWTGIGYADGTQIRIDDSGRVISPPDDVDRYLTYIVRYSSGQLVSLTQQQFAARIGIDEKRLALQAVLDHGGRFRVSAHDRWFSSNDFVDASQPPDPADVAAVQLNQALLDLSDLVLGGVARLPSLAHADLSETTIADAALSWLQDAQSLRTLSLAGTSVTDELGALLPAQIEVLDVSNTKVGDLFTYELKRLRSLRRVDLSGTSVSATAVAELKKSLPSCEFVTGELERSHN